MCNNYKRLSLNGDIMNMVEEKQFENFTFYIWIDEADNRLSEERVEVISILSNKRNVGNVSLITATPESLIYKLRYLDQYLVSIDPYDREIYNRICDAIYTPIDNDVTSMEQVLAKYFAPEKGERWFIPAFRARKSHLKMKDLLMQRDNVSVLIINGDCEYLYIPSGVEGIDVSNYFDKFEPSNAIKQIYKEYYLSSTTFVITGNLVISRGITINSDAVMISHAIFMKKCASSKYDKFQLAGRMCGNIKMENSYKPPVFFAHQEFYNDIIDAENLSSYLQARIKEKGHNFITVDDLPPEKSSSGTNKRKRPSKPIGEVKTLHYDFFEKLSKEQFKSIFSDVSNKAGYPINPHYGRYLDEKYNKNGFYTSIPTGGKEKDRRVHTVQEHENSRGLGGTTPYRVKVGYRNPNDPTTGVLIIHYLVGPRAKKSKTIE